MLFWTTLLALITGSLENTLHITPQHTNHSSTNCTHVSPCMLTAILVNPDHYLKSNTTVFIHSGVHQITQHLGDVLIQNVQNLDIHGSNDTIQSKIICKSEFSLLFLDLINLSISYLQLSGCSSNFSSASLLAMDLIIPLCKNLDVLSFPHCEHNGKRVIDYKTVAVVSTENVTLNNIIVTHSHEVALLLLNIQTSLIIREVQLHNNSINCIIAIVLPLSGLNDDWCYHHYTIINASFKQGNTQKALASGFNIWFQNTYYQMIYTHIENVIIENNDSPFGNVLIQVPKISGSEHCVSMLQIEFYDIKIQQTLSARCIYDFTVLTTTPTVWIIEHKNQEQCLPCTAMVISESEFIKSRIYISFIESCQFLSLVTLSNVSVSNKPCVIMKPFMIFINAKAILHNMTVHGIDLGFFQSDVTIDGKSTFLELKPNGITFVTSNVTFKNETAFINSKHVYSLLFSFSSQMKFIGNTQFINNTVTLSTLSCLSAYANSAIMIKGSVTFNGNECYNGGGISLLGGSTLTLSPDDTSTPVLVMTNNYARNYGGAIYIEDYYTTKRQSVGYKQIIPCTLLIKNAPQILYHFENNTANLAGHVLYGGWLDYCNNDNKLLDGKLIFFPYPLHQQNHSTVASNALRVCLCSNNQLNCKTDHLVEVFPGEVVRLSAVAVGQRFGITPATVRAEPKEGLRIDELELLQNLQHTCTEITYTIQLAKNYDNCLIYQMRLKIYGNSMKRATYREEYSNDILTKNLDLTVLIKPCAKGYFLNTSTGTCDCASAIKEHGLHCDVQSGTIERGGTIWINAVDTHNEKLSNSRVIIHRFCPLDYCNEQTIFIDLSNPDTQCQYNRSGVLCGKCSANTSAVFGSARCMQCSNYWTFLIVPLILFAGLFFVTFLKCINLTVSQGTLNGVIFYANIIQANQTIYFAGTNSFLKWFIAWLNFDLGFEVCFYGSMDTYTKTWLQFVLPVYVWILVLLMIIFSHYSTKVARLVGNNAVQVLVTLFLLSYTKLLRIIIASFSFTVLEYPDGYIEPVWLYDSNVQYLNGKHLVLFIVALTFLLCLSIPYTLLLFLVQWVPRFTSYRILQWVTRLMPIFDAYTGPYKSKHRYWTGLLLLVRVLLFLVFSLNVVGDPTINLLAITITVLGLLMYSAYIGGVYRKWPLDLLENSFHLNLGVVSSVTLYMYATSGDQSNIVLASTGITFIVFLLIIIYHICLKISSSTPYLKLKEIQKKRRRKLSDTEREPSFKIASPTHTVIELQELLIDNN